MRDRKIMIAGASLGAAMLAAAIAPQVHDPSRRRSREEALGYAPSKMPKKPRKFKGSKAAKKASRKKAR